MLVLESLRYAIIANTASCPNCCLNCSVSQRKLAEVIIESQHHEQQRYYLKKAKDALNDLVDGRHKTGNPKNVRPNRIPMTPL